MGKSTREGICLNKQWQEQGVISVTFRRIDENTIRCIITEEDMQEYNVEINDFFKDRQKVNEFLHAVVERAAEEIGYEVQHGMLSMQLVPLPKNRLAITFSDKPEMGLRDMLEQVKNHLGDLGDILPTDLMDQMPELSEEEANEIFESLMEECDKIRDSEELGENKNKKQKIRLETSQIFAVLEFSSLRDVEKYVTTIFYQGAIRSDLYKETNGTYSLVIEKARMAINKYNSLCEAAKEYCIKVEYNPARVNFLKEHAVCMIEKKAVKVLQGICEG